VLQSAIQRIHEAGYTQASLIDIARHDGLSKSALLHHFPSRAALMAEVIAECWRRNKSGILKALDARPDGISAIQVFATEIWHQFRQPHNLAEIEILIASRSDAELRSALALTAQESDSEARVFYRQVRTASGMENSEHSEAVYTQGLAILRGLAMELALGENPQVEIAASIWIRALCERALE
jgi:AcrR family transcriptional regulator